MFQSLLDIEFAPRKIFLFCSRATFLPLVVFSDCEQFVRAIRVAIQNDVLNRIAQVLGQVFVNCKLAGVYDAHIHTRANSVIQESRVNRLAHNIVATKGERYVANAAAHQRVRQRGFDLARRLDEIEAVVGVFFDARRDRKNIWIENDVGRVDANFFGQDAVTTFTDLDLAVDRVRLT